ncbi:hypothetical protein LTR36_001416 [Oleoguttula mirabilis]|uniref:F-box domain-containing protein n=1 Tax=Oleoguttula mirabilis TaxID=1507867 RepID=A0AAV9JP92_9PEZI|nr:hypothetical protein LTR36_001416 [Oleoguttula mirabilis]
MAAATAVFGTYELLEDIIARLQPPSIRRAGAVARGWLQLVQRSAPIRQARCIVPTPQHAHAQYDAGIIIAAMLRLRDLRLNPSAQAVFDTYELLEKIITFLPPSDIGNCRRVGPAWNQLVLRSKAIRRLRALRPLTGPLYGTHTPLRLNADIPEYDGRLGIRIHPILSSSPGYRRRNSQLLDVYRSIHAFDLPEAWEGGSLQEAQDAFATWPPLAAMSVVVRSPGSFVRLYQTMTACYVSVIEGIRVKDLVEIRRKVEQTCALGRRSLAQPIAVTIEFASLRPSSNTRHLRSWSDRYLDHGNGRTRSGIARDESWLRSMDSGAEEQYVAHCMKREGWVDGEVGYLLEFYSRVYPGILQHQASDADSQDGMTSSDDSALEADSRDESGDDCSEYQLEDSMYGDSTDEESSDEDYMHDESGDGVEERDLGDYDHDQYRDGLSDDDY